MKIFGAVLAAGTSSRMGCNKLLLRYKGYTVIERVLDGISGCALDEIVVVTGFERDRIEKLVKTKYKGRIKIVYNKSFRFGRAESIKCAVRNIGEQADAILFMVADKPTVGEHLINRAVSEFKKKSPEILYVKTPAGRGHPIIFSKELFDELMFLEGDQVGEGLIARHKDDVVELTSGESQIDIDTIEDYRMLTE
jgi:molybdenum cofactor cytidylyltransferase